MLLNNKNTTEQSPPFMTNEELMSLLIPIISPEYNVNIKDWLYYAKPNEKNGLYIISKVIKHKGEKIFRTQLTKTKEDLFNPKLKNKPKIKVKEDFKIKSVDVKYVDVDNNKIKYRNNKELKDVYKNKSSTENNQIDISKNNIIKNYISTQEYRKAHNLTYNNTIDYNSNNEIKKNYLNNKSTRIIKSNKIKNLKSFDEQNENDNYKNNTNFNNKNNNNNNISKLNNKNNSYNNINKHKKNYSDKFKEKNKFPLCHFNVNLYENLKKYKQSIHNEINNSYKKNKKFFESVYENKKDNKNLLYKNYQKRTNDINNMIKYLNTISNDNNLINNIKTNNFYNISSESDDENIEDHEILQSQLNHFTRKSILNVDYSKTNLKNSSMSLSNLKLKGLEINDEKYINILKDSLETTYPLFYLNSEQKNFLLKKVRYTKIEEKILLYSGNDKTYDDGGWSAFIFLEGEIHFFNIITRF